MLLSLLLLFSLFFQKSFNHETKSTCDAYFDCLQKRTSILKSCENSRRTNLKCLEKMMPDFQSISNFENLLKIETRKCIEDGLNLTRFLSEEKVRFCAPYLTPMASLVDDDCGMKVGKITNRCEALRSCCDPASRCEQNSIYTETGRTLSGLKEEVNIKMAECAQLPSAPSKKSPRILKSPPFSLCLNYLQCQKDAHNLKISCFDPISPMNDADCAARFASDVQKMHQKRVEAFDYLDKCVPVANVTREFMITDRVCRASALRISGKKEKQVSNCHVQVARKRKECAILRDCCVQADVCERSALYAVISDEYLLRRTELRQNMELCQNAKNSHHNNNNDIIKVKTDEKN